MRARGGPWRWTGQDSTRRINQDPTLGRSDERGGEGGKLVARGGRTKWKKADGDDDIAYSFPVHLTCGSRGRTNQQPCHTSFYSVALSLNPAKVA